MQTINASTNTPPDIREELRGKLLALPFSSFLRCLSDLLEKMGYSDIQLSSRKDWRGRNGKDGSGGFDLTARLTVGGVVRRIVIQAKQFDDSQRVFLSQVDALRGVCLRAGASEALLLTTGPVSSRVPRPLLSVASFAPVRLIDGEELLDLLISHHIGVWEERGEGAEPSRYGLDDAYFADLARERRGNSREDCAAVSAAPASPHLLVTVAIQPLKPSRVKPAAA